MPIKFQAFWILWQPEHHTPPTVRFESRAKAEACAERMAKQHGKQFFVLKAEAVCEISAPPVKWSYARVK